jgi:hypothetical protein
MAARGAASSIGWTTRRMKRDTGVFFGFVFFHVEENEPNIYQSIPRTGVTSPDPPPKVAGLDQYEETHGVSIPPVLWCLRPGFLIRTTSIH